MNLNNSDISVYGQGSTPGIQFGKYLQYGALPKIFEWTNNKFHDNLGYYLVSGWEPFQVNHTNSEFYNLNTAMLTGGTYRNCTFPESIVL